MIIGIDLGTSTTEAAIYRNGEVEMIPNQDGDVVTPSVIGLDDDGEIIIGKKARDQYSIYPDRTVMEVKRKLGTNEVFRMGGKDYTPVELSAILLKYVRSCAEEYLGETVNRAVISVPAYFNDIQRRDVLKAGEEAGFQVERIINEPTAAALSYGINHMKEESHILVYDLGGGTFDVTLLEMFDGVLEVKASSGDSQLGGKDFDESLVKYLQKKFRDRNNISATDPYAVARLKDQAEICKIALSLNDEHTVRLPVLVEKNGVPYGLETTITREDFSDMIRDLVTRTHESIDSVLEDSNISRNELDRILLVGGSTRVPLVQEDIEQYLGQQPSSTLHPDYSVSEGAAIQAAIIDGVLEESSQLIMTDVNPFSLGISAVAMTSRGYDYDYMSVIIPRNTTIPVSKKDTFYTLYEGQDRVRVKVYQGESSKASANQLLGEFMVEGIPWAPAEQESLEVSFSYDLNGILKVEAIIKSTGSSAKISVNMLDADRGEKKKTDERINVSNWKDAAIALHYRATVRRAEKLMRDLDEDDSVRYALEEKLYQLKKAVLENDEDTADEIADDLRKMIGA